MFWGEIVFVGEILILSEIVFVIVWRVNILVYGVVALDVVILVYMVTFADMAILMNRCGIMVEILRVDSQRQTIGLLRQA